MNVYSEDKKTLLEEVDLNKGYLKEDIRVIHYPAIPHVEEKFHYEVLHTYPNNGKDVVKVIDAPGQAAQAARDVEEPIYVYIPYSEVELTRRANIARKEQLEHWFNTYFNMQLQQHSWQTDYTPSTDSYFNTTYSSWEELIERAKSVRAEINDLRATLGDS